MTRLFIRFYLGVILILFVAWLQIYVVRGATQSENIKVVEDALGGGVLSVRDDLIEGGVANYEDTVVKVQSRFAYPVNLVKRSDRPMSSAMQVRIDNGEAVFHRSRMNVALPESDLLLEFGPLPQFAGPTRGNVLLSLGSVFLLAAIAIAILMRPIANQFRSVERTAIAITEGDFSARINTGNRKRGLPIVDAFNKMADRVESLLRSQKELLQAVSHELRTPLARIKFAAELVRSAESEQKRGQRLDAIDEATDRLDDLVGELLDYTRLDEGSETSACETVRVDELVSEAVAIHSPLYPEIQFELAETAAVELIAYRAGLLRAIGNLVGNAGKYAKSRVRVSITHNNDSVMATVDDDGGGIDQKDRELIFEPFQRLASDTKPGAGLGLALVRRICGRLNGEVTVETSQWGGARFVIRLPKPAT